MSTISEVCEFADISDTTFHDLKKRGVIKARKRGGYDIRQCVQAILKDAIAAKAGRGDHASAVNLSIERTSLAKEQTMAMRFKNAVMRGDYVSLSVVRKAGEKMLMVFRERILSIPGATADKLTPYTPQDRGAIELILRDVLYEALNELSNPAEFGGRGAA